LPERGDRRAPIVAAGNATNLTITVLDAIRDRQIPQSDYPKVHTRLVRKDITVADDYLVVGDQRLGAQGRRAGLLDVSRENMEKVSMIVVLARFWHI